MCPHQLTLTRNQQLVLDVLRREKTPLSAYTILGFLRDHGIKAPLQIYRALDKLMQMGHVHRLESVNAFVACRHGHDEEHDSSLVAFAICKQCGTVIEFGDAVIAEQVKMQMLNLNFQPLTTILEVSGLCAGCAKRT